MVTNNKLCGIKPFNCREDSTSVWGQDGGDGKSHFNFMLMAVGSQQSLKEWGYFYIVQEWKSKKSLRP